MAQVQAQLLTVMKRWSFTYFYDSRLLIISDLENTSVLVLGRSVALGFKRWKFSYHQLREYPSMKSWFFFFSWKSILSSYKGHVILHFRQRAVGVSATWHWRRAEGCGALGRQALQGDGRRPGGRQASQLRPGNGRMWAGVVGGQWVTSVLLHSYTSVF